MFRPALTEILKIQPRGGKDYLLGKLNGKEQSHAQIEKNLAECFSGRDFLVVFYYPDGASALGAIFAFEGEWYELVGCQVYSDGREAVEKKLLVAIKRGMISPECVIQRLRVIIRSQTEAPVNF